MPYPSRNFADALVAYLTWLEHNRGRSRATVAKYEGYLLRLRTWAEDATLDEKMGSSVRDALLVTVEDLQRFAGIYAHSLGLGPRSRRPMVSALRGFYAWAAKHDWIAEDPAAQLDYPTAGRTMPNAIALEHAERLLMVPDIKTFLGLRDAALIAILIGCGMRVSGLLGMNESALHWTREGVVEQLTVLVCEKGARERLVPVPAEAAMLVRAYLGHPDLAAIDRTLTDGDRVLWVSTNNRAIPAHDYHGAKRRLSVRSFAEALERYGAKAKVPINTRNPHAFRHLYGTELAEDDVDLLQRQALLGHEDPKSTEIYTHLAQRKLRRVVDKSNPLAKMRSPLLQSLREIHKAATKDASAHSRGPAGAKKP